MLRSRCSGRRWSVLFTAAKGQPSAPATPVVSIVMAAKKQTIQNEGDKPVLKKRAARPSAKSASDLAELRDHVARLETRLAESRKYGLVWREPTGDEDDPYETEKVRDRAERELPLVTEETKLGIGDDASPHLLIEGDNYYSLSGLTFTHQRKVDVIYIDPPYNTGRGDFAYNDKFVEPHDPYRHSKWLSFIAPRLHLARELLAPGGLIFISIDDHEAAHLMLLCDEIFGSDDKRRLGPLIWFYEGVNDNNALVRKTHEYILCYQPDPSPSVFATDLHDPNIELPEKIRNSVVKNGPKNPPSDILIPVGFPAAFDDGVIAAEACQALKLSTDIVVKDRKTTNEAVASSGWSSAKILRAFIKDGMHPVLDSKGQRTTFHIRKTGNIWYEKVRDQSYLLSVLRNLGTTSAASDELRRMGLKFDYPKPVGLIKFLLRLHSSRNAVVLDFFAGSGTTGQAVLELNADDDGARQVILCTDNQNDICRKITRKRLEKVIKGYTFEKDGKPHEVVGLGGAFRFFSTGKEFIERSATADQMRAAFRTACRDLIRLKANCFTPVKETKQYAIFSGVADDGEPCAMAILYQLDGRDKLISALGMQPPNAAITVYAFSLRGEIDAGPFRKALGDRLTLGEIPEQLLRTYERVFQRRLFGGWSK